MYKKLIDFLKDFPNQKKYANWLFEYSKQYIWSIAAILFFNISISLLGIASSVASKYVVDLAVMSQGLTLGIILMAVLTAISISFGVFSSIYTTVVNEKYSFSLRIKLYDNILKTKFSKLSGYHSGDLITRMTSDINTAAGGITSVMPSIITLTIQLITAFFVLFYYDYALALFALISGPIAVAASIFFAAKLKKLQIKVQESESAYSSFLHESMNNLIIIKSFSYEEESIKRFARLRNERFNWVFKRSRLSIFAATVLSVAFSAGYLAAFTVGAFKISQHLITYGTMTLFLSMVAQIQSPLIGLGRTIPNLVSVLASVGRIIEITNLEKEKQSEHEFNPKKVNIKLNNLSFGYNDKYIVTNVNLDIKSGDKVVITGKTGIGKTTLIKLLMNIISPSQGEILYYDNIGAYERANSNSRKYIGYIPQGNYLFSGSIADNLKIGKPDATHEEMYEALKYACAHDFVNDLPKGIDTVIGERGEGLSEGQGQRIALARAFIRKPPLLILDEATSALDENTEYKILKSINSINYNPTCLIITHRSAAVSICNRHIHIEDQKVYELSKLNYSDTIVI